MARMTSSFCKAPPSMASTWTFGLLWRRKRKHDFAPIHQLGGTPSPGKGAAATAAIPGEEQGGIPALDRQGLSWVNRNKMAQVHLGTRANSTGNRAQGPRPASTPHQPTGWGDLGMEIPF